MKYTEALSEGMMMKIEGDPCDLCDPAKGCKEEALFLANFPEHRYLVKICAGCLGKRIEGGLQ
tara:strand:- start:382 stop:570 length:189 start_codon:yes stop_codon:yes gene_type:complete